MNLKPVLALTLLFLTACAAHTVKDDSPASDLDVLKATAERHLSPRRLPNGKTYCMELARTQAEQDECAGDLEDAFYLSEQDKARGLSIIRAGIERLRLARNPCGALARLFRVDRCTPEGVK